MNQTPLTLCSGLQPKLKVVGDVEPIKLLIEIPERIREKFTSIAVCYFTPVATMLRKLQGQRDWTTSDDRARYSLSP